MSKQSLTVLFSCLFTFLISCNETVIEIPKPCTEAMEIPYTGFNFTIETDISSHRILKVYKNSMFLGDSIIISRNGNTKSARISAYICKDQKFYISVAYNDTTDNSGLKIEGILEHNWITGKILYCTSIQNCNYFQIGNVSGQYVGLNGRGLFYSPMFNGEFFCSPAQ